MGRVCVKETRRRGVGVELTYATTNKHTTHSPQLDASSLQELDDEELKVVASEVQDLKMRLGTSGGM